MKAAEPGTSHPLTEHQILLRQLHAISGCHRKQLAGLLGIHPRTLWDYEHGVVEPPPALYGKLCRCVGLSQAAFAGFLKPAARVIAQELAGGGEGATPFAHDELASPEPDAKEAAAFEGLLADFAAADASLEEAMALVARLRSTPQGERLAEVERNPVFHRGFLVASFCETSAETASTCAKEALEWAETALAVARKVRAAPALQARREGFAQLFVSNALRVGGDLRGAGNTLSRARKRWRQGAGAITTARLPEWRWPDIEASLHRELRQLARALELCDSALDLAPLEARGRIRLNKSKVFEELGQLEQALEELSAALPLVEAYGTARELTVARFNLARALTLLGRFSDAAALLPEVRKRVGWLQRELDRIRFRWLEGSVAAGLGNRDEAIAALQEVQQSFTDRKIAYDAALVSLELAVLYLEEGRTAEVRALAQALCWIFESQGVEREAVAALQIFCDAARKERATAELARELLGRVQGRPSPSRPSTPKA